MLYASQTPTSFIFFFERLTIFTGCIQFLNTFLKIFILNIYQTQTHISPFRKKKYKILSLKHPVRSSTIYKKKVWLKLNHFSRYESFSCKAYLWQKNLVSCRRLINDFNLKKRMILLCLPMSEHLFLRMLFFLQFYWSIMLDIIKLYALSIKI